MFTHLLVQGKLANFRLSLVPGSCMLRLGKPGMTATGILADSGHQDWPINSGEGQNNAVVNSLSDHTQVSYFLEV